MIAQLIAIGVIPLADGAPAAPPPAARIVRLADTGSRFHASAQGTKSMSIPPTAKVFDQPMDPENVVKYGIEVSRAGGADPFPVLEQSEDVASYVLSPSAEAAALGVSIKSGGGYDPQLNNDMITCYPIVAAQHQGDAAFLGEGALVGVQTKFVTTSTPAQTKVKTTGLRVQKQ